MKSSIWKSFRFEIVLYSLLSLFYTLLTETVFYFCFYLIRVWTKGISGNTLDVKNNIIEYQNNIGSMIQNNMEDRKIPMQGPPPIERKIAIFMIVLAIIIGIGFFIFYFLLLTRKSADYLKEIAVGINEIAAGNFNTRISIKSEDEFGLIAEKLNKMTEDIVIIMENERKSENEKNELITSVAHDLRTPLTSIIGYLDLALKEKCLNEEEKHHYIQIAYTKSKRLEKLIEDLFSYTKVSFGQVTINLTKVDMVKFMQQMVDEFYPSFQEANLDYEFTTNTNSAIVMADGDLLARAVANLIGNAVKYGKDGKKIRINLLKDQENVHIIIVNYGEVIPEKDIKNIFDRFYRVESSRSRETGGSGLGLAIAKKVILMHKGTIDAKSDLDGTIFQIVLKLCEKKEIKNE